MVGGDVAGLGEVVGEVEQRPLVVGEVAAALEQALLVDHALRHVVGGGLPAVGDDRTRAEHLEVLHRRAATGAPASANVARIDSRRRPAAARRRRRASGASMPARVEHRRHEVDRVHELVAHLARRRRCRAASARSAACACRRATCSASTAAAACCRPTPSPTSSGCRSGSRRARRSTRGCPRRCRARAR